MHQFFIRDSCFRAFSPCTLLTLSASVAAAQKCESKLSRFLALHTFTIWHSFRVHKIRLGNAKTINCFVAALAFYYIWRCKF